MTTAVLQIQRRPSASISKPQKQGKTRKAQLLAIAPRYQLVSEPEAFDKAELTVSASVNLPRTRLPPRSRFGCWICRTRKVNHVRVSDVRVITILAFHSRMTHRE
ncbi:hypothetical protein BDR22DRAFT_105216 [Usnea florida]